MRCGPLLAAALCALNVACGASQGTSPKLRDSLLSDVRHEASVSAQWRYHPPHAASLLAREAISKGRTVYMGRGGERWLVDETQKSSTPASQLASEALIAAAANGGEGWAFVGEAGTVYLSTGPLSDFITTRKPPETFAEVSSFGKTILALGQLGRLWQSDDLGTSWNKVGPAAVRFAVVAFAGDGKALALAVPEQDWFSLDAGRSWAALANAPLGIVGLVPQDGKIFAQGILGRYLWTTSSGTKGEFLPATPAQSASLSLPFEEPKGPSASALQMKHAVVIGGRYLELARVAKTRTKKESGALSDGSEWELYSGPIDGALERWPLPSLAKCSDLAVTGFAHSLYLACAHNRARDRAGSLGPIELFASDDQGRRWNDVGVAVSGKLDQLMMAVGASGAVILSGVCAASKPDCVPSGMFSLQPSKIKTAKIKAALMLQPGIAPSLEGGAVLLFSRDGRVAYGFGHRTKSDVLGLFVSRDSGRTFEAHDVEGVQIRQGSAASLGIEQVSAGADGSISLSFAGLPGSDARVAVVDDQGRLMALSPPPRERVTLAVQGVHAVAVDRKGADWWESLDGGMSWRNRGRLPATVCTPATGNSADCLVKIACFESGCVFGESLTRLGSTMADAAPSVAGVTPQDDGVVQEKYATPLGCTAGDKEWQRLPLVERVPNADQAALGGFAWFALGENPVDSEVVLWRANSGKASDVERRQLLMPASDATHTAYYRSLQVEGAAAIRFKVPSAAGQEIGPVEVAWEDLVHAVSVHQQVATAGRYLSNDSEGGDNAAAQRARPALLSISEGGLYLRVHNQTATDQETFFLNGKAVTSLPRMTWPADLKPEQDDLLRVDKQNFPVLFLGSTALVRAKHSGGAWSFSAEAIGWLEPERFGLQQAADLTYWQGHPALHLEWFASDSEQSWAQVMPFSQGAPIFDPPIAVPTQMDLAGIPAPCSASDRALSPRVVARAQNGNRHPLLVTEGGTSHVLITESAVLHGSKEKPCVAAFDAATTNQDSSSADGAFQAIIDPSDLEHAWLFRRTLDAPMAQPYVEYRTMSCRFDAALEVPVSESDPTQ